MVLCVGKLKEKYWTDAVCEYAKRLSPYCTLKIDEVKEARLPDNAGPAEEEAVKEAVENNRGLKLTDVVKQGDWRAVMAEKR